VQNYILKLHIWLQKCPFYKGFRGRSVKRRIGEYINQMYLLCGVSGTKDIISQREIHIDRREKVI